MTLKALKFENDTGDAWREVEAVLAAPPAEFRAMPLWAWNDRLDEATLRHQVRLQAEAGLGGFFIHARAGLRVDYLSDEWKHLLAVAIDEARKQGLLPWFYDEWGWPSGMTGGRVPALGEDYQQKFLLIDEMNGATARATERVLGTYDLKGRPLEIATVADDTPVLCAHIKINSAYADVLHAPAIAQFIESTYDWHHERFGDDLGGLVPGFFTDEPQYGRYAMPWSVGLEQRFQARHGYALLPRLAQLARDLGEDYRQLRHDFWRLVADAFEDAFARPLGEWCARHKCSLTGHALLEEDCRWQTLCSGTAQGFYRHQQIPGIDWLGRRIGNVVIGKQVSSVADQLGRRRVLSEMFAAGGWNASLDELKWLAEWQFVTGINLMCPHLEPYTIRGARKRDYPPFPFFQAPWWPQYRTFNEHFARLTTLLAKGRTAANILVLHPVRSAWMETDERVFSMQRSDALADIDDCLERLCTYLSAAHLDYHLGDEAVLRDEARVDTEGLKVGAYAYRVVLLPPSGTLMPSTVSLLESLVARGVAVFRMGRFPDRIDGRVDARLGGLRDAMPALDLSPESVASSLVALAPPRVRIDGDIPRDRAVVLALAKRYDGADGAFVANLDRERGYDVHVSLAGEGALSEIDLATGAIRPVASGGAAPVVLAPAQSRFFVRVRGSHMASSLPPIHRRRTPLQRWRAELLDLNALTLDHCRWRDRDGEWSAWMPTIEARRVLLEGGRDRDLEIEYRFEATTTFSPDTRVELVIEDVGRTTVHLNGEPVAIPVRPDCWFDTPMQCVDIAGRVRAGENIVRVGLPFRNTGHIYEQVRRAAHAEQIEQMLAFDTEVESIYVRGDFAVECWGAVEQGAGWIKAAGPFAIREGRPEVDPHLDLTRQGLWFYRGCVALRTRVDWQAAGLGRAVFGMSRPLAAAAELSINGKHAGSVSWSPFERDITELLVPGANEVELILRGTNRNLLGPHHHPDGELLAHGPYEYDSKAGWDPRYCLVPFGLGAHQYIEERTS